jgi:hypothetical protein
MDIIQNLFVEYARLDHSCTKTGTPTKGFCSLDLPEVRRMLKSQMTDEQVESTLKKWIAANAAVNRVVDACDQDGYGKAAREAATSGKPYAIYCGLCLHPFLLVSPEPSLPGRYGLIPSEPMTQKTGKNWVAEEKRRPLTHREWLKSLGCETCVDCGTLLHEGNAGLFHRAQRWCESCF